MCKRNEVNFGWGNAAVLCFLIAGIMAGFVHMRRRAVSSPTELVVDIA